MNKFTESLKDRFPNNVIGEYRYIGAYDFVPSSFITVDDIVTDIRIPLEKFHSPCVENDPLSGLFEVPFTEEDLQMLLDEFTEKIKKIIS